MNVYDFAAVIEAKRALLRHTHAVQCGQYTNEPQLTACDGAGVLESKEVLPMRNRTRSVNPRSASNRAS